MSGIITVLGAGAMGTACAVLLSENVGRIANPSYSHAGRQVTLWARNPDCAREMATSRENRRLLPGVPIPPQVEITSDLPQALNDAEILVLAIPSKFLRDALQQIAPHVPDDRRVVSVVKGLENETFMRPSEIIRDVLGDHPVVALGGPSHAEEFIRRLPASVVAAGEDLEFDREVQEMFNADRFRVYTNPDIVGVELAGALKNVVGIAAGICDGLDYGDNAKSALMTRGLVEMTRFGVALGAETATFSGLAGIGDLITTCISPFGRNRRVGERLGRGETLQQILDGMQSVAEGITTTKSVYDLARSRGIEMPITAEIYRVLFENKSPVEATDTLMLRPPKEE